MKLSFIVKFIKLIEWNPARSLQRAPGSIFSNVLGQIQLLSIDKYKHWYLTKIQRMSESLKKSQLTIYFQHNTLRMRSDRSRIWFFAVFNSSGNDTHMVCFSRKIWWALFPEGSPELGSTTLDHVKMIYISIRGQKRQCHRLNPHRFCNVLIRTHSP